MCLEVSVWLPLSCPSCRWSSQVLYQQVSIFCLWELYVVLRHDVLYHFLGRGYAFPRLFWVGGFSSGSEGTCTSLRLEPMFVPISSWHLLYRLGHSSLLICCLRVLLLVGSLPLAKSFDMARLSSQLCLCSYAFFWMASSLICASLISLLSSLPSSMERAGSLALSRYASRVSSLTRLLWLSFRISQYESSGPAAARSGLHSCFPCFLFAQLFLADSMMAVMCWSSLLYLAVCSSVQSSVVVSKRFLTLFWMWLLESCCLNSSRYVSIQAISIVRSFRGL